MSVNEQREQALDKVLETVGASLLKSISYYGQYYIIREDTGQPPSGPMTLDESEEWAENERRHSEATGKPDKSRP